MQLFSEQPKRYTVFLASVDTSDISKTADEVFEMFDDTVEKVGEDNVVQVVTDNGANYKAAGELLMEKREYFGLHVQLIVLI